MAIDIFSIKPTTISRTLRDKSILLFSKPKMGKTTFAAQSGALILGFEKGVNAIAGAMFQPINKWSDFKMVLRQLEKPEAREIYETIAVDTVSIAWQYCEEYVCAQNGVQKLADVPWGGGYSAAKKEFESSLRKIIMLGYGLILIAHSEIRLEEGPNDTTYEIVQPQLPKRATEICNGIVDLIGYIGNEFDSDGISHRYIYTRETPTIKAGSRFQYLAPKIPFGYKELTNALAEAIEKAGENGAKIVDSTEREVVEILDFNAVQGEARELWEKLVTIDASNADRILKKIEMIFGRKMKLSEVTEDQVDLLFLAVLEMRELIPDKN